MRPTNSLIFNQTVNGTGITSSAIYADCLVRASFQVAITSGAVNGIVTVQASNDQSVGVPANQFQPTNWTTLGSATVVFSTTATSNIFLIQAFESSYEYLRLNFTGVSSASGVLSVRMKGLGA